MRIAVITAVWRRYELADAWWAGLARVRDQWRALGHDCDVYVAGSEDRHQTLTLAHDGIWCHAYNDPLGAKFNTASQRAYHDGADAVLIMGADDFLSSEVVRQMAAHLERGAPYVGLSGCWFYDLATGRACLFQQYPPESPQYGTPVGLGRLLHRSALPRHGRPWLDDLNRSLDWSMTRRCKLPPATIIPVGEANVAVDVKTSANLWGFDKFAQGLAVTVGHPALAEIPELALLPVAA